MIVDQPRETFCGIPLIAGITTSEQAKLLFDFGDKFGQRGGRDVDIGAVKTDRNQLVCIKKLVHPEGVVLQDIRGCALWVRDLIHE
jgi:hypothetical protein